MSRKRGFGRDRRLARKWLEHFRINPPAPERHVPVGALRGGWTATDERKTRQWVN